jgi:hypothetical protein
VSLAVAVALVVVAGACTLVAEVGAVTVIQRAAPAAVTARVFGVYDQLNVGAIAVGSALAGPLVLLLGARGSVAVTGLVVAVAGVAAARRLRLAEATRPTDVARPVTAPTPHDPRDLSRPADLAALIGSPRLHRLTQQ